VTERQLQGKVAWITGAGSGIGRCAAVGLAREGATVVLTGRRPEALTETAKLIGEAAKIEPGDVTDAARIAEIASSIGNGFNRLDIVVNNAGINIVERKWRDLKPAAIDQLLATNLHSAFYCVVAALPLMRARKDGLFIHIGSRAGRVWDGPSGACYITSKAALAALSHSINREECLNGIRSCIINPGETVTPILKTRGVPVSDEEISRLLTPEDCADVIRYIACLPARVCMSEVMLTPTWNRSYVTALMAANGGGGSGSGSGSG
jgi:NADP-dependent 3-hydroxy acid dehydrogenase YdfG